MSNKVNDIEAYIQALLDITNNSYIKSIRIVCNDIQAKEFSDSLVD